MLQIPSERIIRKMERELQQLSQGANEKEIREHALIIRSLCDLLLEEQEKSVPLEKRALPVVQSKPLSTYIGNEEPSDSLLDF